MPTHDPVTGAFDGAAFVFPLRVYYEDTDAAGIVYHANYLKFAERARSEMLRTFGTDNARLMTDEGLAFVVRGCTAEFRRPARLDELLHVRTRVTRVDGASFGVDQRVHRADTELVTLGLRLACMNADGRAARIPKAMREALQGLEIAPKDGRTEWKRQ